jgi:hypothetical protein
MLLLMDLFATLTGVKSNKPPKIQHLAQRGGWYTFSVSGSD